MEILTDGTWDVKVELGANKGGDPVLRVWRRRTGSDDWGTLYHEEVVNAPDGETLME